MWRATPKGIRPIIVIFRGLNFIMSKKDLLIQKLISIVLNLDIMHSED
jgi:hypothetical protein